MLRSSVRGRLAACGGASALRRTTQLGCLSASASAAVPLPAARPFQERSSSVSVYDFVTYFATSSTVPCHSLDVSLEVSNLRVQGLRMH